jgi:hypothetical protein
MAKENAGTRSFREFYVSCLPTSGQAASSLMRFLCNNKLALKIILGIE